MPPYLEGEILEDHDIKLRSDSDNILKQQKKQHQSKSFNLAPQRGDNTNFQSMNFREANFGEAPSQ